VLLSAPGKNPDITIVKVLNDNFGIDVGFMVTVHA